MVVLFAQNATNLQFIYILVLINLNVYKIAQQIQVKFFNLTNLPIILPLGSCTDTINKFCLIPTITYCILCNGGNSLCQKCDPSNSFQFLKSDSSACLISCSSNSGLFFYF